MIVTAFSGSSLVQIITNGFIGGIKIGTEAQKVVTNIAGEPNTFGLESCSLVELTNVLFLCKGTIPSQVSATWLNWIIFRFSITLPLHYVLQANAYFLHFFGFRCCARLSLGGGSGGQIPYRLYIDSGVVLLCVFALGPASPLVAAAAFIYFLFSAPILRRNLIFMYRPQFDAGGVRWPFLFDMCVSCLIVGQMLLTIMMALKSALGPAIVAAIPVVPTYLYRSAINKRFRRAFEDASLLQTAALDGWDPAAELTMQDREEFRKFLVDSHKAAYVPVCIAGDDTDVLTAEPAVVVPTERDEIFADEQSCMMGITDASTNHHMQIPMSPPGKQSGATMRRLSMIGGINVSASISVSHQDSGDMSYQHSPPGKQHGVTLRRLSMVGRPGMGSVGANASSGVADCGSVISGRSRGMTDDTIVTNLRSLDESLGANSGKQRRAALEKDDVPDDYSYSMYSRNADNSTYPRTKQHGATFRRMSLICSTSTGTGSIAEEGHVLNDDSINSEAYDPNFRAVLEDIRKHKHVSSRPKTCYLKKFSAVLNDLKSLDDSCNQVNGTIEHACAPLSERDCTASADSSSMADIREKSTMLPTPRQHGATFSRMSLTHPLPSIQKETLKEEDNEDSDHNSGTNRSVNNCTAFSTISPRPFRYDNLESSPGLLVDLGSFSPRSCRNLTQPGASGSDLGRGAYSSPRSKSFRYVRSDQVKQMFDEIIPLKGGTFSVPDDTSVSRSVKEESLGDRSSRRQARTLNAYIPPPTRQHGATFRRLSVAVPQDTLLEEGQTGDSLSHSSHHSRSVRSHALNDSAGSFGAYSPLSSRNLNVTMSPAHSGRSSVSQRSRSLRHINLESPGSSPGRGSFSSRSRSVANFALEESSFSQPIERRNDEVEVFEDESVGKTDGLTTPPSRQHGATFRRLPHGRDSTTGEALGSGSLHSSSYHSRSR
jgi:hypothetical protein